MSVVTDVTRAPGRRGAVRLLQARCGESDAEVLFSAWAGAVSAETATTVQSRASKRFIELLEVQHGSDGLSEGLM
jgi:hypothetical protein